MNSYHHKGGNINLLSIDGIPHPFGRYPNPNAKDGGFLTIKSHSGDTVITTDHDISNEWDGAELVIRKTQWIFDRTMLIYNNEREIHYSGHSLYSPTDGFGFFLQNHKNALDVEGEWYINPIDQKIGIWVSDSSTLSLVNFSQVDTVVIVHNQQNIIFQNLEIQGSNCIAISQLNTKNVELEDIALTELGGTGVRSINSVGNLYNKVISKSIMDVALFFGGAHKTIIKSCELYGTGLHVGSGGSGDDSYQAIIIRGDSNLIQDNIIDSVGYTAVRFEGSNTKIVNNLIKDFTLVKDDGGGIYTWSDPTNILENSNQEIHNNIILNGIGNGFGSNHSETSAHGIYIDDRSKNIVVRGNTVANCSQSGLFLHNSSSVLVEDNTLFNNKIQLFIAQDHNVSQIPIRNLTVRRNLLVAANNDQLTIKLASQRNDFHLFGSFDYNQYCRPTYDDNSMSTEITSNRQNRKRYFGLKMT